MLSTFLCHIVPYGRPWAVLELHWHHGYLGRSRKGQKRTQRPFICFTLCVSLSPCPTETRTHTLTHTDFKHLEELCISTLLCALHWCAHSVFMCGISMQTEPPLCVCVPIGWGHAGAGTHWQMGHTEAFYICWRICIVTATAAQASGPLSSELPRPPSLLAFFFFFA